MFDISVILCTHNPRTDFLRRVIAGLRGQTLRADQWELILVDNASTPPLESSSSHAFPLNTRIVVEQTPGLTRARIAGIAQCSAELLVFVDDDAVLAPDYLEQALEISRSHPHVGAFGGNIELEFQSPPDEWTRPHWPRLAQRSVEREMWSNFNCNSATTPWGVGMCLRKTVAAEYVSLISSDPVRLSLDRNGTSLMSGGDEDMARTSHRLGMATGLFPKLSLLHLIPPSRLELDYLLRLVEGQSYSGVVLDHLYQQRLLTVEIPKLRRTIGKVRRRWTMSKMERLFFEARLNGQQKAIHDLAQFDGPEDAAV
jgi:glycosyltransferase involved in cell wall biosynthesis